MYEMWLSGFPHSSSCLCQKEEYSLIPAIIRVSYCFGVNLDLSPSLSQTLFAVIIFLIEILQWNLSILYTLLPFNIFK